MGEGLKGGRFKERICYGRNDGLVWWEWLVLVAVVVLLTVIAIPNFMKYTTRSKQVEAKRNLKAIYNMQVAYKANHGVYADSFDDLNYKIVTDKLFVYQLGMGDSRIGNDVGDKEMVETLQKYGSEHGYAAVAVGNLDSDATLDIWVINEKDELVNAVNDVWN